MNMFARFDENPAMTLRVIKETKRYGRTDARTDGRTDNVKTVYPLQTKFGGGGINITSILFYLLNTPYEIWVQTAQWFLRKRCLDTYVAVQNEQPWMKGQRSAWPLVLI